jgi:hypothetical protein
MDAPRVVAVAVSQAGPQMVQDRYQVVGGLDESPPRESAGGSEARALGEYQPKTTLLPSRMVSSEIVVSTPRRTRQAQ